VELVRPIQKKQPLAQVISRDWLLLLNGTISVQIYFTEAISDIEIRLLFVHLYKDKNKQKYVGRLLKYCAMKSRRSLPTLQTRLVLPSSGR
jgi:hypothetical protein